MNISSNQSSLVKLKGVGDSLWVTLDPNMPIESIKEELAKLFKRLRHLATNARVILDPGEQNCIHDSMIETLGRYLKEAFGVGIVTRPPSKRSQSEEKVRTFDMNRSWQNHHSEALVLTGRVRSGQKVTARKHLIIMGDVNPGAEIIARGDILVLGSLRGTAAAGQPNDEKSLILAIDFRPSQVQIGGFVAAGITNSPGKSIEYAYVDDSAIVVDDYIKSNPFSRIPWPQAR